MADTIAVNLAIESFENWQQPWSFYSSVVGHPKCSEDDRRAFEVIWSAACDKDVWLSGETLQDCCVHAADPLPSNSLGFRLVLANNSSMEPLTNGSSTDTGTVLLPSQAQPIIQPDRQNAAVFPSTAARGGRLIQTLAETMVDFDPPIYIKPMHPKGDVITFGKGPNLERSDSESGIARFGGGWRNPSYLMAYVRAADVLVSHGKATNTLDDIGLPAFYMQRHALELLVKRLLSWAYQYAEATVGSPTPSKNQLDRFKRCHGISALLKDLRVSCERYGFAEPPESLRVLVEKIESYEVSETWSRYENSESKDRGVLHHLNGEVALPIVSLQENLEAVVSELVFRFDGNDSYENELYYAWADATGVSR